jgi:hypothetical protein
MTTCQRIVRGDIAVRSLVVLQRTIEFKVVSSAQSSLVAAEVYASDDRVLATAAAECSALAWRPQATRLGFTAQPRCTCNPACREFRGFLFLLGQTLLDHLYVLAMKLGSNTVFKASNHACLQILSAGIRQR